MLDPSNADLLGQLKRIADALSRAAPSPWTEWAKTLASFIAGVALTYIGIFLQDRIGDRREQQKMRRVVYGELSHSIFWLYDIVSQMPAPKSASEPLSGKALEKGYRDPPSLEMVNPSLTFEGEEYMRDHHSVAYELSEMAFLKRTYLELHNFSPGAIISVGDFKSLLIKISKEFKGDPMVRKSFRRFLPKNEFATLTVVANHYADHKIRAEELFRVVLQPSDTDTK